MSFTYPAPPATVGSDLSTTEVHYLMKNPTLLVKRLAEITRHKFIADFLLSGRFTAEGGALLYETGEEIFPADAPEEIAPGGEYPRTTMTSGELAAAKTAKWGGDSPVTDEAISRLKISPVDKALRKTANGMIRTVDGIALSVIASKITESYNSGGWADAMQIIESVLMAKATAEEKFVDESFDYNVVVLKPTQFAKVAAALIKSDLVPRESGNVALTGVIPDYMGLTWTTSTHVPFTDPLLVDPAQLGGIATENIQSPGYSDLDGVEVKSLRDDDTDSYRIRGRRVLVPVVLEARAGIRITGTGV